MGEEFQESLRNRRILSPEVFQQSSLYPDAFSLQQLGNVGMVSRHTSDRLVLSERAGCVSRSASWGCGSGRSSQSRVLAPWFPQGGPHSRTTEPVQPSVSLGGRPHLASRKLYLFFPSSGFVSTGHGGLTCPRGHVPFYSHPWIMTGHPWWG